MSYNYHTFFYLHKFVPSLRNCKSLETAPDLPATQIADYCYSAIFQGCNKLINVPSILPATNLANGCYENMFNGCSSLTQAPTLPSTTLAERCYHYMFNGCSSLKKAPELLATTLLKWCYRKMFAGCSSLDYIICYAEEISAQDCLQYWVQNVAPNGTFKCKSTTSWKTGTGGIPSGWTRENI